MIASLYSGFPTHKPYLFLYQYMLTPDTCNDILHLKGQADRDKRTILSLISNQARFI
jgi:hypothetical protein